MIGFGIPYQGGRAVPSPVGAWVGVNSTWVHFDDGQMEEIPDGELKIVI
jgi:hypothetical protein